MSEKCVDRLGRIVIPKGYREKLGLAEGVSVSITYDEKNETLILKKSKEKCLRCFCETNLIELKDGIFLCSNCMEALRRK